MQLLQEDYFVGWMVQRCKSDAVYCSHINTLRQNDSSCLSFAPDSDRSLVIPTPASETQGTRITDSRLCFIAKRVQPFSLSLLSTTMTITTPITELFKIQHPILLAGQSTMFFVESGFADVQQA